MKLERFNQREIKQFLRTRCSEMLPSPFPESKILPPYMRCKSSASWKVDDIPYCNRHAGNKALLYIMSQQETEPKDSQ